MHIKTTINNTCSTCAHFGELLPHKIPLCLAPITTKPTVNAVTKAEYRFVYTATPDGICELWTPENP